MSIKSKNTRKKMASLGLKKNESGDYIYIDINYKNSEFVPVRKRSSNDKDG
jgi:hypothetical protein